MKSLFLTLFTLVSFSCYCQEYDSYEQIEIVVKHYKACAETELELVKNDNNTKEMYWFCLGRLYAFNEIDWFLTTNKDYISQD